MIHGFDISHHNGLDAVDTCVKEMNKMGKRPSFCFIKITEGKTYVDAMWMRNIKDAVEYKLVVGLYHYARPENNNAIAEAIHFCNNYTKIWSEFSKEVSAIPILDWEGEALKYNRQWARDWCDYVFNKIGIKPMIYISRSECHMHRSTAAGDYGLWVAAWRDIDKGVGNVAPWTTWAVWQYTSEPFDMNVFNGTVKQLKKYTETVFSQPDNTCDCECHFCGCCLPRSDR